MTPRKLILTIIALCLVGGLFVYFKQQAPAPAESQAAFTTHFDESTRAKLKTIHEAIGKYLSDNELGKARKIADQLVKEYPGDKMGHEQRTEVLARQGLFHDAFLSASNAAKLDPNDDNDQFLAGVMASKSGNLDKAKYHFTQACVLAPSSAKYAMYLGETLLKANDVDNAQLQLLRAAKLDSTIPQVPSMLAEIAARRGKLEMALEFADQAIDRSNITDPHQTSYYLQKATYLRRLGKPEQALEVLHSVNAKHAHDPAVLDAMCQSYLMMSRPAAAGDLWALELQDNPRNVIAAAQAGIYYAKAGNTTSAQRYYAIARRIDPNHPMVLQLDESLRKQGATSK